MMESENDYAASDGRASRTRQHPQIAIIGGGPSGLMTAYLLERRTSFDAEITLFEASGRLGGKMRTRCFDSAPVSYEAGVAECYDLRSGGPDPLRNLVHDLRLTPVPMQGNTTLLNGAIVRNDDDLGRHFGTGTLDAVREFRRRAATLLPPAHWRRGFGPSDAGHPMAGRTAEDLLNGITDPVARRYVKTISHSDLATEPHLTSGLIGLSNVLKSVDGYGAQYTFEEGVEMLPRRLAERLTTTRVELDTRAVRLSGGGTRRYALDFVRNRRVTTRHFDAVVLALPYNQLLFIELDDRRLRRAMTQHVAQYEPAAHYLRVSMLFRTPFWRSVMTGSWFMLDGFGGCCVYDEGAHRDAKNHGVLGWLLAGTDALVQCNADEGALVRRMLDALPAPLRAEASRQLIEVRVHRWAGGAERAARRRRLARAASRPSGRERAPSARGRWRLSVRLDAQRRPPIGGHRDGTSIGCFMRRRVARNGRPLRAYGGTDVRGCFSGAWHSAFNVKSDGRCSSSSRIPASG